MSATSQLACGCTITRSMFGDRNLLAVTPCLEHVKHPEVVTILKRLREVLCSLNKKANGYQKALG